MHTTEPQAPPSAGASTRSLRTETREAAWRLILARGSVTRSQIAHDTGVAVKTIDHAVKGLIDEGLVVEDGIAAPSGRGRPGRLLRPRAPRGPVGAIDFGHKHINVAVAGPDGQLAAWDCLLLDVDADLSGSIDTAVATLKELTTQIPGGQPLRGLAAALPEPIDPATSQVLRHRAPSVWVEVNPREELQRRTGLPVLVENDCVAGALGELHQGAGRGCRDFLYVKVATGVGAAIVADGRVYRGGAGVAGEIGHIPLPGFTGPCHCGTRGCLEAAISLRSVEEHLARTGLVVSGPEAFEDNLSHPALARILQDNGRILGQALAWMCNLLAPSRVILGGWLAHAGRTHMADAAMAAVERHAHPVVVQALSIVNSELAPLAELKGALLLAQDTFATP